MKKLYLIAAISMVMFACSKDNDKYDPTAEEGLVFELATVNIPTQGSMTRTRPLYSQEALQEVERVNIHVFKKSGNDYLYLQSYNVPSWSKGTSFQRFAVPDNNKLVAGDYSFLVIGQEATDNYTITSPTANTTNINDMLASVTAPGNESEIFAGMTNATVSSEGVRVGVEMTRKVAGILGYFKNVPAVINNTNVQSLRLTVSNANKNVFFSSELGSNPAGSSYDVININLNGQTVTSDGVYAGVDMSNQGVVKVANSQLAGKFILPVSSITMTLGLYDVNNNLLKGWTVVNSGSSSISLMANHFYSLGQKVAKGNTTGGTPDPGDDDAPIDLLKDQVIAITINPNWNTFHNLGLQN